MSTPKSILKGQPWYVRAQWWSWTVLLVIVSLPFLGLALINPFWFRQSFFDLVESCAYQLARLRDRIMKSQLDKYKLFDKLKDA